MYLRKIKPSTTCLYSAASMFLRSLSADFHNFFSKASSCCSLFCFFAIAGWFDAQNKKSRTELPKVQECDATEAKPRLKSWSHNPSTSSRQNSLSSPIFVGLCLWQTSLGDKPPPFF